jgi:hypothetical protein
MSTAARYRISQKGKMKCPGPEIITGPQNSGGRKIKDRIEGRTIVLDSDGEFPKKLIIVEAGGEREYQIVKTRKGGYLLN